MRISNDKSAMLKFDSIEDAWKFYSLDLPHTITLEHREELRIIFYGAFGLALHFWGETEGDLGTFNILHDEYLSVMTPAIELACAKD